VVLGPAACRAGVVAELASRHAALTVVAVTAATPPRRPSCRRCRAGSRRRWGPARSRASLPQPVGGVRVSGPSESGPAPEPEFTPRFALSEPHVRAERSASLAEPDRRDGYAEFNAGAIAPRLVTARALCHVSPPAAGPTIRRGRPRTWRSLWNQPVAVQGSLLPVVLLVGESTWAAAAGVAHPPVLSEGVRGRGCGIRSLRARCRMWCLRRRASAPCGQCV
jgi:hypothetical protein